MKKYMALLLCCLSLSGCKESGEEQTQAVCKDGEVRCTEAGKLEVCEQGAWGTPIDCAAGKICRGDTCVDTGLQPVCTNGAKRCSDAGLLESCVNGSWDKGVSCGANQECKVDACVDKGQEPPVSTKCTNGAKRCSDAGLLESCVNGSWDKGVSCGANQECKVDACVDKGQEPPVSTKCTNGAKRCSDAGLLESCVNGTWDKGVSCGANQECKVDACVDKGQEPSEGGRTCGNTKCTGSQLCLNKVCVERNNKAIEGQPCDPNTFVESCDGNKLVYCLVDTLGEEEPVTAVSECGENGTVCALRVDENFGNCVAQDVKCSAETAGAFAFCVNQQLSTSYLDKRVCAEAVDGKYYPFRMEPDTEDCLSTCLDDYRCDTEKNRVYSCKEAKDYCDGDIVVYCDESLVSFSMNCADYDMKCVNGECQ